MDNIATLKLISGEELIAEVQSGSNPLYLTLVNPVLVHKTASPFGPMLSVSHWLMFTKTNQATIKKEKIVALEYDLEDNTIKHFERFTKERGAVISLDEQNRLEDLVSKTLKGAMEREEQREEEWLDSLTDPEANTTIH